MQTETTPLPADWTTKGAFLNYPAGTRDLVFVSAHTIESLLAGTFAYGNPFLSARVAGALTLAGWAVESGKGHRATTMLEGLASAIDDFAA